MTISCMAGLGGGVMGKEGILILIAVITVEPAVLRFSHESEAFG